MTQQVPLLGQTESTCFLSFLREELNNYFSDFSFISLIFAYSKGVLRVQGCEKA